MMTTHKPTRPNSYEGDLRSTNLTNAQNQDDIVIAVMGSTGTGKSSFVRFLTGSTAVAIGNSLESQTSDVQIIRFLDRNSGHIVTIVDTPGFDDSRKGVSDTDILKKITKFLLDEYDKSRKLNGLVYLQRISDPRFSGQSGRNLKMFRGLCGADNYKNVVILTTFWDKVTRQEGIKREEQLKSEFFKELVRGEARFARFDRTTESAHRVLKYISMLSLTNVRIQEEIRVEGKSLEDTEAGSVHRKEVEEVIAKHKRELAELRIEMVKIMVGNAELRRQLEEERAHSRQCLARWEGERAELKKGLDDARSNRVQLRERIVTERMSYEQTYREQEHRWSSKLASRAKTDTVGVQRLQEQLYQQQKTNREVEKIVRDEAARAGEEARKKMFEKDRIEREADRMAPDGKDRWGQAQAEVEEDGNRWRNDEGRRGRKERETKGREEEWKDRQRREADRIAEEALINALEIKIGGRDSPPPPYENLFFSTQGLLGPITGAFQFVHSDKYPPYMDSSTSKDRLNFTSLFDFTALLDTTVMLFIHPDLLPANLLDMAPNRAMVNTLEDLVNINFVLHNESQQKAGKFRIPLFNQGMYFNKNVGLRGDWYTDAVFGQQQFVGTNPTTITLASRRWRDEFLMVSNAQQRPDIANILTSDPENLFLQDYSDFRAAVGLSSGAEINVDDRYGCASVVLFHLEPKGQLHPLAITLDYKGSMEESVTIFNHRTRSTADGEDWTDWPWRYAKMCAQTSDWYRHELAAHLVNTHLVEEVIIVAANRAFDPKHVIFKLLEPHWNSTLLINSGAREVLVPKIIIGMVGFTAEQTYAFIKHTYSRFDWVGSYVPNDLRRRGFPVEKLNEPKYHNYAYARNVIHMWKILRKFVGAVLTQAYVGGDVQVRNDSSIAAFCHDMRSDAGGQLSGFPMITTLDQLIDFATMCIHIASPQHTAVNYLQQYYQTFVPNKPASLYTPLPRSVEQLESYGEQELLLALPIHKPRDWLLMAHVPYLLSFEIPDDGTILYYATMTSEETSVPASISSAARVLRDDLVGYIDTVLAHSEELDDQKTPYLVMDPTKTAISILI